MKLWYCLQSDFYDAWDFGFDNLTDAYVRLMSDSEFDRIAVIDVEHSVCLREYTRGELDSILSEGEE